MARGRKPKSIEEHIANGTYRADRHGVLPENEQQTLQRMKNYFVKMFDNTKKELEKIDISTQQEQYKFLQSLLIEQTKVYNTLIRKPIEQEQIQEQGDGKIDI
jgi:hypothetical protein